MVAASISVLGAVPVAAQHAGSGAVSLVSCRAGEWDNFDGPKLDRARRTAVVRETSDLRLTGGHLIIPTTPTDIIGTDEPLTPNIVLQALPSGPFMATAKLALAPRYAWDQAGLVIYSDDDNYAKLVFQARGGGKAEMRFFQFLVEKNGKVASSIKTEKLGAAYPDSAWVRLTSDGRTLRAAYSADGVRFTDMPESKDRGVNDSLVTVTPTLDGLANPRIGLIALAGRGGENPVLEAKFDWFELRCAGENR